MGKRDKLSWITFYSRRIHGLHEVGENRISTAGEAKINIVDKQNIFYQNKVSFRRVFRRAAKRKKMDFVLGVIPNFVITECYTTRLLTFFIA